jgi:two-component system response regulator DesR
MPEGALVVRTLIAHRAALLRGALAFVLSQMDDIEVIGQLDRREDIESRIRAEEPDMAVIDLDLFEYDALHSMRDLRDRVPECGLLVIAEPRKSGALIATLAGQAPDISFLAEDVPPEVLVDALRRTAKGEQVVDPEMVVAGLRARSPLTIRETEVLRVTARGEPVKEVAARLRLSPGTVRNHLSRIIAKTGARSRIEAVRIADEAGWI